MKFKSIHTLWLISYIMLLICCDNGAIYDRVDSIPSVGWSTNEKYTFEFPINDTNQFYDIMIHIRNQQTYGYSNLWLFIETTAPNNYVKKDTFEIILADQTGRWLGKGIGNVNSMLVPYRTSVSFPFRGIYRITLQQGMYDNPLMNLLDIGIRVQPHK